MNNICVDYLDYIADCIDAFLTEQNLTDQHLDLGYTFSFPVLQTSINRGILKHWTKGFSCTGAAGKDPVMQLQDALLRKQIPVRVAAIVNDTVGTLLSNAYSKPQTLAGMILGTGANGAYIERMSKIGKWKGGETTHPEMIINMELGSFDNERRVLPVTRFDNKVDRESINPHSQIYEKMVSGMYLGEIARNVLLELMDRELLFGPKDAQFNPNANCKHISGHYAFETEYMSRIEADDGDLRATRELLDLNLDLKVTEVEARIFKRVCEMVGRRAARLAACAIAAIVQHCEVDPKEGADIGIDGSLYEFYPCFEERIYEALEVLLPDLSNVRDIVRLGLAKDGSGVGAALTACVAARMAETRQQQKNQGS
jgi:hexokinase